MRGFVAFEVQREGAIRGDRWSINAKSFVALYAKSFLAS